MAIYGYNKRFSNRVEATANNVLKTKEKSVYLDKIFVLSLPKPVYYYNKLYFYSYSHTTHHATPSNAICSLSQLIWLFVNLHTLFVLYALDDAATAALAVMRTQNWAGVVCVCFFLFIVSNIIYYFYYWSACNVAYPFT